MKRINLQASWVIKDPRDSIYKIVSDFENMPKNLPQVAHSVKIVSRDGNKLLLRAEAKSHGTPPIPVTMETTLVPGKGYIYDNTNPNSKLRAMRSF